MGLHGLVIWIALFYILAGCFVGALAAIALLLFTNAGFWAVIPIAVGGVIGGYIFRRLD